jgi:hypothetical protein
MKKSPKNKIKAYIVKLKFGIWKREFWFEGEDSPRGNSQFNEALKGLTQIGDNCKESEDFFEKAINHFQGHGFTRIKK